MKMNSVQLWLINISSFVREKPWQPDTAALHTVEPVWLLSARLPAKSPDSPVSQAAASLFTVFTDTEDAKTQLCEH